jgi:hypothetical protein
MDAREQPEVTEAPGESSKLNKEERIAKERALLVEKVANADYDTLTARVAWLLNHSVAARDSDIALQIKYWQAFEPQLLSGRSVALDDLYKLTRLTSLSRARAKIQNEYQLFLASEEVRQKRGVLEGEERDRQREDRPDYPTYTVYADESGKTGDHLIVGSMWVLGGLNVHDLGSEIQRWRDTSNFRDELHFSKITNGNIDRYFEVLNLLFQRSAVISFKALRLERRGQSDSLAALNDMLFHLLVRGVKHEHESGRGPLPRAITVWKDAEEPSRDKLAVANLTMRLKAAAVTEFDNKLFVSSIEALDSGRATFIQLADLFIGSINRTINNPGADGGHPKDRFAAEFLRRFGAKPEGVSAPGLGDMVFIERV